MRRHAEEEVERHLRTILEAGDATVAERIVAAARSEADLPTYGGRGVCYLEFGGEGVAVVDVTFVAGQAPFGFLNGPSAELTAEKSAFGTTRIKRWFDRDW